MTSPASAHSTLQTALQNTLGAAYDVERELGAGGMARVFLATEKASRRRVAIKVLAPAIASCCDAERFRQEMALAASLDHPNIVPLLRECDFRGDGRLFYFVMPYVEGESLRARLAREGSLPVREVVRVLRDVTAALSHAHRIGVVHRDIKPENVLLSEGRALVTDFGIAKALVAAARPDSGEGPGCAASCDVTAAGMDACAATCDDQLAAAGLTVAGYMVGTPTYAAPEQALGDPATDYRADLYSLGVLAYEMLAGAPPFGDRSPLALIAAHLTEAPPAIPTRPDLPPPLVALVSRLLEKEPRRRPASSDAVLLALAGL